MGYREEGKKRGGRKGVRSVGNGDEWSRKKG